MYKPGQIITINKVKYRIMKSRFGCAGCDYIHIDTFQYPCIKCPVAKTNHCRCIKLVKLCGNQDRL